MFIRSPHIDFHLAFGGKLQVAINEYNVQREVAGGFNVIVIGRERAIGIVRLQGEALRGGIADIVLQHDVAIAQGDIGG